MINAELFKKVFGIYAEEFWAYSEEKMLDWLASDTQTADVVDKERYDRLLENSTIISEALSEYQTADAVEVVRCKDCKWYGRADKRRFYRGMDCLQHRIDTIVPDKDFCSRGERRTDDGEVH